MHIRRALSVIVGLMSTAAIAVSSCRAQSPKAGSGDDRKQVLELIDSSNALMKDGKYQDSFKAAKEAVATAEAMASPPADLLGQAYVHLGGNYSLRGNFAEGEKEAARGLTLLEQNYGGQSPMLIHALDVISEAQIWEAKYGLAEKNAKRALAILGPDQAHSQDASHFLETLSEIYTLRGEKDKVEPLLKQMLDIAEKAQPQNAARTAEVLGLLSRFYLTLGQVSEAEQIAVKISRLIDTEEQGVSTERQRYWSYSRFAAIHEAQHKYDKAEDELTKAKEIAARDLPPDHPLNSIVLNRLAGLYIKEGKYAEAETIYKQVLTVSQSAADTKSKPTSGPFQLGLSADVDVTSLNPASAEDRSVLDQALSLSKKEFGNVHPVVATALTNLGNVCMLEKKSQEALSYYQKALDIRKQIYGVNSQQVAISMQALGLVYERLQQPAQAEQQYRSALDVLKQMKTEPNPHAIAVLQVLLGRVQMKEGQLKAAEDSFMQALPFANQPETSAPKLNASSVLNQADEAIAVSEHGAGAAPALQATALSLSDANSLDATGGGKSGSYPAVVYLSLSDAYVKEGKFKDAESACQQAIAVREKVYGPEHAEVARAYMAAGDVFQKESQLKDAEVAFEKASSILQNHQVGAGKTAFIRTLERLSRVDYLQGKYDQSKSVDAQLAQVKGSDDPASDNANQQ